MTHSAVAPLYPSAPLPLETTFAKHAQPRQKPPTAQRRARFRQQIKVPMRLIEDPAALDASINVYMKVKALGLRPDGCTASVATLARYLSLSKSTVERALTRLRAPGSDGVVELPDSTRRSLPGGIGTTARRRVRPVTRQERFVWLPVTASELLRPRLLRTLAVITHAAAQRIPLSEACIAGHLHHHSGSRAGQPVTVQTVRHIVRELTAQGWVTCHRRAGPQGRHLYDVTDLRGQAGTMPRGDGSGPQTDAGSLAKEEDLSIDRPSPESRPHQPAVGDLSVVDDHGRSANSSPTSSSPAAPQARPPLTFSHRVHTALAPAAWLLSRTNRYVNRLIGRETGRQLAEGATVDQLQARIQRRLGRVMAAEIKDPGRWLLGVGLPRWGCGLFDCEEGVLWESGRRCEICAQPRRTNLTPCPTGTLQQARPECPECERPYRGSHSGVCRDCRDVGASLGDLPVPGSSLRPPEAPAPVLGSVTAARGDAFAYPLALPVGGLATCGPAVDGVTAVTVPQGEPVAAPRAAHHAGTGTCGGSV
ncbi:hypothetical protein ACFY1B_47625 [Streptomyces mirabilis]|uniref:hypothetical protein n=1 Tax=Streptomyces mirabilis TaxID=68239 RepID=UPI00368B41A7